MKKMYNEPIVEVENLKGCPTMQGLNPVSSGGSSSEMGGNIEGD